MRLFTAVALLLWQSAAGIAQEIVLAETPLHEEILPRSRVSTEIVMGVMLTGTGGDGKPPALGMAVPRSWVPQGNSETMICVRVNSKNGRYAATNAYRILHGAAEGQAKLDFNSSEEDFLSDNAAAVRITLGDCRARPRTFAPALWAEGASDRVLNVFLNAGGQRAAVASDGPGDFVANCRDESEETGLKYTARCEIPLDNLNPGGKTTLYFTVNRNRTAEHFQIEIALPGK